MQELLLIDDDAGALDIFAAILRRAGYRPLTASSGRAGLELLKRESIDLAISDLRLPDISGIEVLKLIRRDYRTLPVIIITAFGCAKDVVNAMRSGASDFVEKPLLEEDLLLTVRSALENTHSGLHSDARVLEAYAADRWAQALVPMMDSPKDLRTIAEWSRWLAASEGALRNWCRTARISPRRSLVFGRMLRAVALSDRGTDLSNLLNVVDRRTLVGLLHFAGFANSADFPSTIRDFVDRQRLIKDPDTLRALKRALHL